jgi:hypothetical protein
MKTLHTPGPWSDDWNFIVVARPDGRENYIAQICESDEEGLYIEDISERAANARLIAAAPELLAALQNLCATARTFRNVPKDEQEWGPIDDEALDAAFTALAKARS